MATTSQPGFTHSKNLDIYQSNDRTLTRQQIIDIIERESREKYPHLHVRFHPDRCMQAKIHIDKVKASLLSQTPQALIDILRSENFVPEEFKHHLPQCDSTRDNPQFVLVNTELKKIGYRFVMKATFGPSFISFWFRNESDAARLDLPIFYALEILNKLSYKFSDAAAAGRLSATTSTGDSEEDRAKAV